MRQKAVKVRTRAGEVVAATGTDREMLIDTAGTGGDASGTFNVSTATAFVVAGAGLKVAKHGNRSVSSLCGSADVVETLGINIELPPAKVGRCVDEVGIGFLYAPLLHTAMKHVMVARREMGIRTVFNLLGPLANPAGARHQVMGVYEPRWVPVIGGVLSALGAAHAFVVHGEGLDEIAITGMTHVCEVKAGATDRYAMLPEDIGLRRHPEAEIAGGDAERNAHILRDVLSGQAGGPRDAVLANAAAALVCAGAAKDLRAGVKLAADSIDRGAAAEKLSRLVAVSSTPA